MIHANNIIPAPEEIKQFLDSRLRGNDGTRRIMRWLTELALPHFALFVANYLFL
jgi:hypothetical protein